MSKYQELDADIAALRGIVGILQDVPDNESRLKTARRDAAITAINRLAQFARATPVADGPPIVDIVFDGAPGPARECCFVEVEDGEGNGNGLSYGRWIERADGMWALRIKEPAK